MQSKRSMLAALAALAIIFLPTISFGLDVGDKAPAFSGNSTQGVVSLETYNGKKNVVLALYFAVFTSV